MQRHDFAMAAGVALLQIVVVATLLIGAAPDQTTRAPVVLVGPPIVSTALVDKINSDGTGALQVTAGTTAESAAREVRDGVVVAAVVIDLATDRDTVLLHESNGKQLNEVLQRQIESQGAHLGRTFEVTTLEGAGADHRVPFVVTVVLMSLGFGFTLVMHWRRRSGRVTELRRLWRRAVAASLSVGAVSAALVQLGALHGSVAAWFLTGALGFLSACTLTAALARFFGPWGYGVSSSLFVLTAAPLLRATHPLLLPGLWRETTPWIPHGAVLDATTQLDSFEHVASPRPWLLLVGVVAVSCLTFVLSEREDPRAR